MEISNHKNLYKRANVFSIQSSPARPAELDDTSHDTSDFTIYGQLLGISRIRYTNLLALHRIAILFVP